MVWRHEPQKSFFPSTKKTQNGFSGRIRKKKENVTPEVVYTRRKRPKRSVVIINLIINYKCNSSWINTKVLWLIYWVKKKDLKPAIPAPTIRNRGSDAPISPNRHFRFRFTQVCLFRGAKSSLRASCVTGPTYPVSLPVEPSLIKSSTGSLWWFGHFLLHESTDVRSCTKVFQHCIKKKKHAARPK